MYIYILKDLLSCGNHKKYGLFLATFLKYKNMLYLVETLKLK